MGEDKRFSLEGIYAALMTPYTDKGKIDQNKLKEFLNFYEKADIEGVFAVSNIGEFAALSYEEKEEIIRTCRENRGEKLKIIPGVSDLNPDNSLRLAYFCEKCQMDAVVLSAPYYYPYSRKYTETYIRRFLEESPLPVVFYHSPQFTGKIEQEFLYEILRNPKVVGLKESSGDVKVLLNILDKIQQENLNINVMVGWEELFFTALVHGARGCITSLGGIVPELMQGIYHNFQEGNLEQARNYQNAVARIASKLNSYGFLPGYKMGMAARIPYRILRGSFMEEMEKEIQGEIPEIKKFIEKEVAILEENR